MSTNGNDPEIQHEFLIESGELLEQVESDLVELEDHPRDANLLNKIFRALHTIKGNASFLALTNLVTIAHAAESTLNAARNGTVIVDRPIMDQLLQAVDLIRRQMGQIQRGQQTLETPPAKLVADLAGIGEGKPLSATTSKATTTTTSRAGTKSASNTKADVTKAALKAPTKASPTPRARLMSEIQCHQCRGLKEKEKRVCDPASFAPDGIVRFDDTASDAPSASPSDHEHKVLPQESTIRVEVGRLECLMNLVGDLAVQTNRLSALSRRLAGETLRDAELAKSISQVSGILDLVTDHIQMAVMRTRMQPLDKLFGKYPRLIRDLASKTGKKLRLVIEGSKTEVDKSVIEELGDSLIHLLRNSADHGIELPQDRVAAGKREEGTITIRVSHERGHVRLQILDDGRGLHRDRIGKKAVVCGLCTEAELASLTDREVYEFIFHPGFSTAEQISDLSGRGVGMDVVRTNIERLKGTIDLASEPGQGTTLTITIPQTVAVMSAMMVAVSNEIYAVPLGNILEVVKPEASSISSIGEHPAIRMRDGMVPLLSAVDAFNVPMDADGNRPKTPFVVVLAQNDRRIGLTVSRLIGQQEIVVKPLDSMVDHKGGPVSGAMVRDDGAVSLIVDVTKLMAMSQPLAVRAA